MRKVEWMDSKQVEGARWKCLFATSQCRTLVPGLHWQKLMIRIHRTEILC